MYEHNALGYMLGLALCLTKARSSRAHCPATALICKYWLLTEYLNSAIRNKDKLSFKSYFIYIMFYKVAEI